MNPIKNLDNTSLDEGKINANIFTLISNGVKKLINFILDFVFPQFCLNCKTEGSIFCASCQKKIKIKKPEKNPWTNYCHLYFDACYVCLDYKNNNIDKLIHAYKYNYLENIAFILADILYRQYQNIELDKNCVISNIPLHPHKKRLRGFDQTELLAKKLSNLAGVKYESLLTRVKKTKDQAKLNKKQRQNNTYDAFAIKNPSDKMLGQTIILIDDVTTTGFTLGSAAKKLREAGYQKIICLVLAKN